MHTFIHYLLFCELNTLLKQKIVCHCVSYL